MSIWEEVEEEQGEILRSYAVDQAISSLHRCAGKKSQGRNILSSMRVASLVPTHRVS